MYIKNLNKVKKLEDAKEAPEKIYVDMSLDSAWGISERTSELEVEYTRTDAFIEKAERWFVEKFEVEDYGDYVDIDGSPIFNYDRMIEDFKNYMKGWVFLW